MVYQHIEIMGWESFDVFRFDIGPLLQHFNIKRGGPNLKVPVPTPQDSKDTTAGTLLLYT